MLGSSPGRAEIGVEHSGQSGATLLRVYSGGRLGHVCVEREKCEPQNG
jgi:hypothetical protein